MTRGVVYLVGAGPGDPGLITVRAAELLRSADVVMYDRLVNSALLEYAPVSSHRVFVGKAPGSHACTQSDIHALMILHAKQGKRVVRLKGGDPFVFGRGGEEARALAEAGVAFEVVPGVSSAVAVPAYAGIPLTQRGLSSSFAVVTGHASNGTSPIDWSRVATAVDTLVVLMGTENLSRIVAELVGHGRSKETPVALIRWGTTQEQEVVSGTLGDIVAKGGVLRPPVVMVIGEVAALGTPLRWFEPAVSKTGATQVFLDAQSASHPQP